MTDSFASYNPATGEKVWEGIVADAKKIQDTVDLAKFAWKKWKQTSIDERKAFLSKAHQLIQSRQEEFIQLLAQETGKPFWECRGEMASVLAKFAISEEAYQTRCSLRTVSTLASTAITRYKPHGVVAVLGPFNFPLHLPNGHIIPALLAGNTVIFKPSEQTPAIAELYIDCWKQAGLPVGVINLIQGGSKTGALLSTQPDLDGLFFTGSWNTGQKLLEIGLKFPKRINALEMGGNNPLVIWDTKDIEKAALIAILSAFMTTGQRCSCARRLIIPNNALGDQVLDLIIHKTRQITVGPPSLTQDPFMGPVISPQAASNLLDSYHGLLVQGAQIVIPFEELSVGSAFLKPGIVDMTFVSNTSDNELFGPLLKVYRVENFDQAIELANRTDYGLTAGIVTEDPLLYQAFWQEVQAGVINWNTPLTGASSQLPFGGIGKSGNYRPSAFYAADYCAYPVSSMEAVSGASLKLPPGIL